MSHTLNLHGSLATKYGKVHKLNSNTPANLIKLMSCNYPTFDTDIVKGVHWHVFLNGKRLSASKLNKALPEESTVDLVPVIIGSLDPVTVMYIIGAILLAGAAYLYTQMPSTNDNSQKSYMFNGAINTNEQGGPVPLVYGHARVGSVVISASVTNEELEDQAYSNAIDGPGDMSNNNYSNFNFTGL